MLTDLERTDSEPPVLVDIGAGTQDIDRALESPFLSQFLRRHRRRVILAESNWEEFLTRSKAHSTQASSDAVERSPERRELYASAGHRLWFTDADVDSTTAALAEAVAQIRDSVG